MSQNRKDFKKTLTKIKTNTPNQTPKTPFHEKPFMKKVTFYCALFGTIVGGWYTCNQIFKKEKPKFEFMFDGATAIDSTYNNNRYTFFLIIGTVSNDGEKPLFPAGYRCEITNKETGSTFNLDSYLPDSTLKRIPYRMNVHYYDSIINQNLSLRKKIFPFDAAYGNLLFGMKGHLEVRNIKWVFKLTCIDIHKKEYVSVFEPRFSEAEQNTRKPRMGISGYGIRVDTN